MTEQDPSDALPAPDRTGHGKMPEHLDDDQLARAAARERAEAGLQDDPADDVPPATDPLPEDAAPEADLAQRGLVEEPVEDERT